MTHLAIVYSDTIEQIVEIQGDRAWDVGISAAVQIRGSIPLFWSQQTNPLNPKPDILLQYLDPFYSATNMHFR